MNIDEYQKKTEFTARKAGPGFSPDMVLATLALGCAGEARRSC